MFVRCFGGFFLCCVAFCGGLVLVGVYDREECKSEGGTIGVCRMQFAERMVRKYVLRVMEIDR